MQKAIVPIVAVLAIFGLGFAVINGGDTNEGTSTSNNSTSNASNSANSQGTELVAANARYIDFDADTLKAESDDQTNLLFFHAVWCSICNSIERNIEAGTIPDDVTIHKVDYDADQELVKKYNVTFQSAFIQVDKDGNEITRWQGQSRDGISEIIENTQAS